MRRFIQGFAVASGVWAVVFLCVAKIDYSDYFRALKEKVSSLTRKTEVASVTQDSARDVQSIPTGQFAPPPYADDMPMRFETKAPGEFHIAWKSVLGAQRYRVFLIAKDGEVVKTNSTKMNELYIKQIPYKEGREIPFVDYTVRIASGTDEGEYYEQGEPRQLRVYRDHLGIYNDLDAPEIKEIVTED